MGLCCRLARFGKGRLLGSLEDAHTCRLHSGMVIYVLHLQAAKCLQRTLLCALECSGSTWICWPPACKDTSDASEGTAL